MLGIYPMTPGAPLYTIASPVFTNAVIHSPSGDITIEAPAASPVAKYVQAAELDGTLLDRSFMTHTDVAGKTLHLDMAAVPDLSWAADTAAPSLSTHELPAFGCPPTESDDPEPVPTTLVLDLSGKGSKRQLVATLTETDSGAPVPGAAISFAVDGVPMPTSTTDAAGRAVCEVDPRYQGGHHTYTARFAGSDTHVGSEAETPS
jgi:hypothetical protein